MKKYLLRAGLGLLGLFLLIFLIGFMLPRKMAVERSIAIKAPASLIHAQVNAPKNWGNWSSWHKKDPNMVLSYAGPESGTGAIYSWKSAENGEGQMKITSSDANLIQTTLDFGPDGTATSDFKFEAKGDSTAVSWGFESDMGFSPVGRYFALILKPMLTKDYEDGLAGLKDYCEQQAQQGSQPE
jgi:hypothetical protein